MTKKIGHKWMIINAKMQIVKWLNCYMVNDNQ